MKKIALSIEQMQKLQSLGLDTSDASMMYAERDENEYFPVSLEEGYSLEYYWQGSRIPKTKMLIPAYTLQDILDKIEVLLGDNTSDDENPFLMKCYDRVAKKNYYMCTYFKRKGAVLNGSAMGLKNSSLDAAYEFLLELLKYNFDESN